MKFILVIALLTLLNCLRSDLDHFIADIEKEIDNSNRFLRGPSRRNQQVPMHSFPRVIEVDISSSSNEDSLPKILDEALSSMFHPVQASHSGMPTLNSSLSLMNHNIEHNDHKPVFSSFSGMPSHPINTGTFYRAPTATLQKHDVPHININSHPSSNIPADNHASPSHTTAVNYHPTVGHSPVTDHQTHDTHTAHVDTKHVEAKKTTTIPIHADNKEHSESWWNRIKNTSLKTKIIAVLSLLFISCGAIYLLRSNKERREYI